MCVDALNMMSFVNLVFPPGGWVGILNLIIAPTGCLSICAELHDSSYEYLDIYSIHKGSRYLFVRDV